MMICLELLLYYECSTVSNTFNVYQAFNFRKSINLFVVSARFCEMYFILQVLLYTFKYIDTFARHHSAAGWWWNIWPCTCTTCKTCHPLYVHMYHKGVPFHKPHSAGTYKYYALRNLLIHLFIFIWDKLNLNPVWLMSCPFNKIKMM